MDWKNSFDSFSLDRGNELYKNQACSPIYASEHFYEGFVEDPIRLSNYFVQAEIKDDFVKSISCSCSTAQRGHLCEHEAAFLFKIEEEKVHDDMEELGLRKYRSRLKNPISKKTVDRSNQETPLNKIDLLKKEPSRFTKNLGDFQHSLYHLTDKLRENYFPSTKDIVSKKNELGEKINVDEDNKTHHFSSNPFILNREDLKKRLKELNIEFDEDKKADLKEEENFSLNGYHDLSEDLEEIKDFSLKEHKYPLKEESFISTLNKEDFMDERPKNKKNFLELPEAKNQKISSLNFNELKDLREALQYLTENSPISDKKANSFDSLFSKFNPDSLEDKNHLPSGRPNQKSSLENSLTSTEMTDLSQAIEHLTGTALHPFIIQNSTEKEALVEKKLPIHFQGSKKEILPPLNTLPKKVFNELSSQEISKDQKTLVSEKKIPKSSLKNLIDSLSKEALQQLLFNEMIRNPDFRFQVELQFLEKVPEDLLAFYLSQIDGIMYHFFSSSGTLSKPTILAEEISSWLQEKIDLLLKAQNPSLAFSLFTYVVSGFESLNFPLEIVPFQKYLEPIIKESDSSLEADIFSWIELVFDSYSTLLRHGDLIKVLKNNFLENKYGSRKLRFLKFEFIQLTQKKKNNWSRKENLKNIIEQLALLFDQHPELIEHDPILKDDIEAQPYFWQLQMEKACEVKNYEQACLFCHKALYLHPKNSWEYTAQIRTLISLLNQEGKKDKASQLLIDFVKHSRYITIEDLKDLREVLDERSFLSLISSLESKIEPFVLAELYFYLEKYEELIELIEEKEDLLLASQYQEALKTYFPLRLEKLWEKEILHKVKNSTQYNEVIEAFEHILSLPHQQQKANDLAKDLQQRYPRKYALLHQLEKLGLLK